MFERGPTTMKIKKIRKGNCLLLLVAAFIIFNFCGCFFEAKADSAEPNLFPVYVQDGDTLWSIVEENYNYSGDIRAAISEVKSINHMSNSNLAIGDVIYIPIK